MNNIKALKIKIGYSIVTPTTPTRLNSIQLSASIADSWVELSCITIVGTCELAITNNNANKLIWLNAFMLKCFSLWCS